MFTIDFNSKTSSKPTNDISIHFLRQAQQSGCVKLCNRSLTSVPNAVWDLNSPLPAEETGKTNVDLSSDADSIRWWELQPISRLILSSNCLTSIPGDGLLKLDTLVHLDIRDNKLTLVPEELGHLTGLTTLILSANQLKQLPESLANLQSLSLLDVSNNQLNSLGQRILISLDKLDRLDASVNQLTSVPQLPASLRSIVLHHNRIESIPPNFLANMPGLQSLELSFNHLTTLCLHSSDSLSRADSNLTTIYASNNSLVEIPNVAGLLGLKELYLSGNRITTIDYSLLEHCPLVTLDLARNRIGLLPDGISQALPKLCRLDVSSNNLEGLPTELGMMKSLQALMVDQNPLRSIRQAVLSGGTNAIKQLLFQRHVPVSEGILPTSSQNAKATPEKSSSQPIANGSATTLPSPRHEPKSSTALSEPQTNRSVSKSHIGGDTSSHSSSISKQPKQFDLSPVSPSGVLDWSGNTSKTSVGTAISLPDTDSEEDWLIASGTAKIVRSVELEFRSLKVFPRGLFAFAPSLNVLNLGCNLLKELPEDLKRLTKLTELDLRRNSFTTIPTCLSELVTLRQLNMDNNALGPDVSESVLFTAPLCKSLIHLSIRGCKLQRVPSPDLLTPDSMPALSHLDLSDNDIDNLPPQLGLCTQLKSLLLTGNTFRVPRPNLVAKGTGSVLEYLRSRLPS